MSEPTQAEAQAEAQPSSEPEVVSIPEATDADLDAYLELAAKELDEEGDDEELEEAPEDGDQEEEEPELEEEPERPQLEDKDAKVTKLEAEVAELRESLTKRLVEREQRETHIQRLKSELGNANKQLREQAQAIEAWIQENADEASPLKLIEAREALREVRSNLGQVEAAAQNVELEERGRDFFKRHVEKLGVKEEDIAEMLEHDGVPPEFVRNFRQNPHTFAPPEALVEMGKRARSEKLLKKLVPVLDRLLKERKQLSKKPGEVLDRISKELRRTPKISAAPGQASRRPPVTKKDLAKMTDAELDQYEKSLR